MTNCFFYAVALCWRRLGKGRRCRIKCRRSHWGNFPHFMYSEQRRGVRRLISYKPIDPKPQEGLPPFKFEGKVAWGDSPPNQENEP